jgi:hypothetical protein
MTIRLVDKNIILPCFLVVFVNYTLNTMSSQYEGGSKANPVQITEGECTCG